MAMWNRCAICGKSIPVGELCYGVKNWRGDPIGGDTICRDCLVPENAPTLTPPNEWISVEERLPPEHEPVLCIVDGKPKPNITLEDAYQIGSWNKADGWIIDEYLDWEDADVSWWMSLPAPPDKDNNVLAKTPNEPLTLDELLTMNGEPVYVVFMPDSSGERSQSWALVNVDEKYGEVYLVDSIPGASCYYDEIWADLEGIYRRPPEGEEDT